MKNKEETVWHMAAYCLCLSVTCGPQTPLWPECVDVGQVKGAPVTKGHCPAPPLVDMTPFLTIMNINVH